MPNWRPRPHPCWSPTGAGVGCLGKCKSSILSGLSQGERLLCSSPASDIPSSRVLPEFTSLAFDRWSGDAPGVAGQPWIPVALLIWKVRESKDVKNSKFRDGGIAKDRFDATWYVGEQLALRLTSAVHHRPAAASEAEPRSLPPDRTSAECRTWTWKANDAIHPSRNARRAPACAASPHAASP